jgi:hypothetical protein
MHELVKINKALTDEIAQLKLEKKAIEATLNQ